MNLLKYILKYTEIKNSIDELKIKIENQDKKIRIIEKTIKTIYSLSNRITEENQNLNMYINEISTPHVKLSTSLLSKFNDRINELTECLEILSSHFNNVYNIKNEKESDGDVSQLLNNKINNISHEDKLNEILDKLILLNGDTSKLDKEDMIYLKMLKRDQNE
jgi:hypothetical protein